MPKSLHPNLAKLAASYDDILLRYSNGTLSAAQARAEITTLVARDDDGILWTIDPDSGQWMRRTRSGDLVASEPPSYGLATPTPHDLSTSPNGFIPDAFVELHEVDNELLYSPSQFAGTTRAPRQKIEVPTSPQWVARLDKFLPRRVGVVGFLVLAGVVVLAGVLSTVQH